MVGFRKDPRLATRYVEIPLDYSVILREPQSTENSTVDGIARLLVGRAIDPDLGELEATAYFNFSPPIDVTMPGPTATFESIRLVLKFDHYSFGATDSTELQLSVHELMEPLNPNNVYDSRTTVPYQPTSVGDKVISPGPVMLQSGWEIASDNDLSNDIYFTDSITLSPTIGQNLLDDLLNLDGQGTINDFGAFSSEYPGFAVTMPSGNKILGFTPVYQQPEPAENDSRIELTYTDADSLYTVNFPIYYAVVNGVLNDISSFTSLNAVRTGTVLDGILPFKDFSPADGNLYTQSGTGIMPKFDLSKVYAYFDTIPYVVINSAELEIENTYTGRMPQDFELLMLDSLNGFRTTTIDIVLDGQLKSLDDPYLLKIRDGILAVGTAPDTRVAILNQLTGPTASIDQTTGKVGSTVLTEFFHQIVIHKDEPRRALAFALHPVDNEFHKTVSKLKISPSSATLKIYYSTALTSPITSP